MHMAGLCSADNNGTKTLPGSVLQTTQRLPNHSTGNCPGTRNKKVAAMHGLYCVLQIIMGPKLCREVFCRLLKDYYMPGSGTIGIKSCCLAWAVFCRQQWYLHHLYHRTYYVPCIYHNYYTCNYNIIGT